MGSSKITQVHVYLIGGVLMLIVGAGLWFALIKPVNEENEGLRTTIQGLETTQVTVDTGKQFTIAQKDQADKALVDLQARVAGKTARLASLENAKQLPRGHRVVVTTNPEEIKYLDNWLLLPQRVVDRMTSFAQQLARRHRVTVQTAFAAPPPVADPRTIPRDIIAWNLGGMSVTGDFNRVMAWAQDWNRAPLLVSVDGLRCELADRPGRVNATASLTVFIFPTGPGVQQAGGGGAAGAGGMGGGMMGGGMGGMNGPMGGAMGPMGGNGPMMGGNMPGQFAPTQ